MHDAYTPFGFEPGTVIGLRDAEQRKWDHESQSYTYPIIRKYTILSWSAHGATVTPDGTTIKLLPVEAICRYTAISPEIRDDKTAFAIDLEELKTI